MSQLLQLMLTNPSIINRTKLFQELVKFQPKVFCSEYLEGVLVLKWRSLNCQGALNLDPKPENIASFSTYIKQLVEASGHKIESNLDVDQWEVIISTPEGENLAIEYDADEYIAIAKAYVEFFKVKDKSKI